jgi:N-glycosylase/DNA lyase
MKNEELIELYEKRKEEIKNRLEEFKLMMNENNERIFAELCFCICTPQSKATASWNSISALMKNGLLYDGNEKQIRPFLNPVRFADKKTKFIVEARKYFTENGKIKDHINQFDNPFELRDWLVENVKGLGLKEASHFLRNIGLGKELAILDRHILKNLKEIGVIKEIPETLSEKRYLEIEQKMKEFSDRTRIPMDELDLLFWSKETGMVFK